MQIKMTVTFHFIFMEMIIILLKKNQFNKVGEDLKKLQSLGIAGGDNMVSLLWKTVGQFLKKLGVELL